MKIFAHINWAYTAFIILIGLTIKILTYRLLPRPYGSKFASWFIRLLVFNPVKKIGKIDESADIYLLNHQSDIDIGIMETTTKRDLAWVAKKELFEVGGDAHVQTRGKTGRRQVQSPGAARRPHQYGALFQHQNENCPARDDLRCLLGKFYRRQE
jgi:hypothetical protein